MEERNNRYGMLDLMLRPAFCVKENQILQVNAAAAGLLLTPGMEVTPLLLTGAEEYAAFESGCLYLQLSISGMALGAAVTDCEDAHIFLLEQDTDSTELRALSLAARELREPLSNLLAISGTLLPSALPETDPKLEDLLARMSRGLYQLQRIVGNMSDAAGVFTNQRPRNIPQVFAEIFEKAAALLSQAGVEVHFEGLREDVCGLIDDRQMERAVLNILSNAVKFLPEEGRIEAKLTRRGNSLRLQIQDNGSGIAQEILGSVFDRYLRQPTLEDSRHGLGLGMVLIRTAAAQHGGTVLIDQPGSTGTRITLTMLIRQSQPGQFHSPIHDLSGGRDQALIELSQCLPVSVYRKER